MKYLMVVTKFGSEKNKWLTNELAEEIRDNGHEVHVVAMSWMKDDPASGVYIDKGLTIYRYKMPRIFYNDNKIVKYIKQVAFPVMCYFKYRRKLALVGFDRVISFSPSHLVYFFVKAMNKYGKTGAYLVLWDFFPYYLNDLSKESLFFKLLAKFESSSYLIFNKIGVMTEKNKEFLISKNKKIAAENVNILPIWAKVNDVNHDAMIRVKYGLAEGDVIFVYGGAHTKIQELDNLLELAKRFEITDGVKFLFIGKGSDKARIQARVFDENIGNVIFLDFIPRVDYEVLISSCDIGLVSLSRKMKVPSFPSKSLDYMKCGLPILASIDRFTDYGVILEEQMQCGYFSYADDSEMLYKKARVLCNDRALRKSLGVRGRKYFEENHSVKNIYNLIENHLK